MIPLKRFRTNLIVAIFFALFFITLALIAPIENLINKNYSNKGHINNPLLRSFSYGQGLCPAKTIIYQANLEKAQVEEYHTIFANIKSALKTKIPKENLNFQQTKDTLRVNINKDSMITEAKKILQSFSQISFTNKGSQYEVFIKAKAKKDIIKGIKTHIIQTINKRLALMNKKNCTLEAKEDGTFHLVQYSSNDGETIELNTKNSFFNAYAIVDGSFKTIGNKVVNMGEGAFQVPIIKKPVLTTSDISHIEWLPYEEQHLISVKIKKSSEEKIMRAKKMGFNNLLFVTETLNLTQSNFHSGFSVINSGKLSYLGFISLKNSDLKNLVIQTIFEDDSKEKITKYFHNGSLPVDLKIVGESLKRPLISKKNLLLAVIIFFLVVFFIFMALIVMYGLIACLTASEFFISGCFFLVCLRFFNYDADIINIFMAILYNVVSLLLGIFKTLQINQVASMDNRPIEGYISEYKKSSNKITRKINIIGSLIFAISSILILFSVPFFSNGFGIIAIGASTIIFCNLFYWENMGIFIALYRKLRHQK